MKTTLIVFGLWDIEGDERPYVVTLTSLDIKHLSLLSLTPSKTYTDGDGDFNLVDSLMAL